MDTAKKEEIEKRVCEINKASEKYQLIHATSAIEKIFQTKIQNDYKERYNEIKEKISNTSEQDEMYALFKEAEELNKESRQRVRIIVEYLSQIKPGNARIFRTENNNFQITLPKEMENIRKDDETIDFDRLKALRQLMAHEIGHVVLHSGVLDNNKDASLNRWDPNLGPEDEAEYFAEKLIELRKIHNEELHMNI